MKAMSTITGVRQMTRIQLRAHLQRLGGGPQSAVRGRRQRRCRAQVFGSLEEWDIVLYNTPSGAAALGRVGAAELQVERLEEDATNQVWIVHGPEERVPLAAVRRTLQADYLQLVDPDRVSNPHGEHALEAYRLLEPAAAALAAAATAGAATPAGGDDSAQPT